MEEPEQTISVLKQRLRWLLGRFALLAGSFAFMAIAGEVALRCCVDLERKRSAIYDPDLGWRGRPNTEGLYVLKADGVRTPFRYNNLGYRDEDVLPKRNGQKRILILGDSFVENLEVEYEHVFHEIMESQLQQEDDRFEAVALGSQGYSNSQELLAFRRYHELIDAEVVLTAFYTGNDFEDNERRTFAYLDDQGSLVFPENKPSALKLRTEAFKRWIYESSYLVYWLKNTIQAVAHVQMGDPSKSVGESDERYQMQITRALLSKLHQDVTETGARHAIVIFPSREELAANELERVDFVQAFCNEHGVPCLSLASALKADEHYLEHDFHFNLEGHRFVAAKTLEFIRDEFGELLFKESGHLADLSSNDETNGR